MIWAVAVAVGLLGLIIFLNGIFPGVLFPRVSPDMSRGAHSTANDAR